jgi:hypothetical protein
MAIVRSLSELTLERATAHSEASSTYSIVNGEDGRYLQIDTYGSTTREIIGKKSQSIRLSKEAILQLVQIVNDNKLI